MYDEIRDELKEKQEELFSWKAQLEMSLAEAPKGKLYRSASNGYEQGTHQQLLERKGLYYRLWEMQQGNFVIKEDSDKDEQFAENFENDDEGVMSYT